MISCCQSKNILFILMSSTDSLQQRHPQRKKRQCCENKSLAISFQMIPLLDRRSACLLLPYMQGLLSFSSLSSPPEESFLSLGQKPPTTVVATANPNDTTNTADSQETRVGLQIIARLIATYTPREVLEAIRDSGGKFLYRGEEPNDGVSCYLFKIPF